MLLPAVSSPWRADICWRDWQGTWWSDRSVGYQTCDSDWLQLKHHDNISITHRPVSNHTSNHLSNFHLLQQVTGLASPTSEAPALVCLPVCGAIWWVLLHHSIMLRIFFTFECGITHFLCVMRVFEVQASSSSLGYLCAKFCFFRDIHSWASSWRKNAYSITQSLTQFIWCPGNQSACDSEYILVTEIIF